MTARHPIARYVPLLIAGDEQGLRDLSALPNWADGSRLVMH